MDGVSHDDLMRLRTDHGSANIAIIRPRHQGLKNRLTGE
jgi:hypothetical protein